MSQKSGIKKIVLAYSGGLDTSIILKWLQENYGCELITFSADLGQGEELEDARRRALELGVREENIFIQDLREELARDYIWPMFRANALYEGEYLLGTSIARPLIARAQALLATRLGADALAHGATGKGNDQVRFELGYAATNANLHVIAPWREWELDSREKLLAYAQKQGIALEKSASQRSPYSMDANLLHISYEGLILEDPAQEPEASMWRWTRDLRDAPDEAEELTLEFRRGDLIGLNGEQASPATLLARLNELGGRHGIGRLDLVENRCVGMKSRGCYETPGGTILLKAHRAIESITLDREAAHLKDELMPRYAALIYNGLWFSPERRMLQALIDESQIHASGLVRARLYKGNVIITGRESANDSLFNAAYSTFEADEVYDQKDAAGFIKLNSLRFIIADKAGRRF